MGIEGIPRPETIVIKPATDAPAAADASAAAEPDTASLAETIVSKIVEAADVVKTIVADTDDGHEHNEL